MNGEKYAAQLLSALTNANAGGERPPMKKPMKEIL